MRLEIETFSSTSTSAKFGKMKVLKCHKTFTR